MLFHGCLRFVLPSTNHESKSFGIGSQSIPSSCDEIWIELQSLQSDTTILCDVVGPRLMRLIVVSILARGDASSFRKGEWYGCKPLPSSFFRLELFELILFLKLDKPYPVEQLEATVPQPTVPPLIITSYSASLVRTKTQMVSEIRLRTEGWHLHLHIWAWVQTKRIPQHICRQMDSQSKQWSTKFITKPLRTYFSHAWNLHRGDHGHMRSALSEDHLPQWIRTRRLVARSVAMLCDATRHGYIYIYI